MPDTESPRKKNLLGVIAYVLVPGERRVRAAGHFQKAGFEALKGVAALSPRSNTADGGPDVTRRERIEIE